MTSLKSRLLVRLGHWLIGFIVHIIFSLSSLVIAVKDWDEDCEDDNDLKLTGSGWLVTSEVILIIYAMLLLPPFLFWEIHPKRRSQIYHFGILSIYSVTVILIFSFLLVGWDTLGIFLLFEEIEDCRGSGLWVMGVISLVRSWIHFMYPLSIVIVREIEEQCFPSA